MQKYHKLTDEDLVTAYAGGDNKAFDALLARHKTKLFNFILSLVKDTDVADDIFQETFIKVITTIKQGRYHESGRFGAWIARIARNLAIDTFRQERAEATVSADDADRDILNRRDISDGTVEDMIIDIQIEDDVRRLVELLPPSQREVLTMRYYQDLSFKEIAELTNVSINTALGRMRYAILNMRRMAKEKSVSLTR